MEKMPLRYWFWWPATTFDTFKADMFDVMQVAKNIYAPLVSIYMDGKPQGMIASGWEVDESGKMWRFIIRPGLVFDDGTPITPAVVLKNFRRILWLTRNEGLILNTLLPEVKRWKNYEDPLECLYAEKNSVVFKFNRRPVNLFETISQSVYGIANPKCFDENGQWKEPLCASSSGQYRVREIAKDKIVLESRHVFPEADHAPEIVEIHTPHGAQEGVLAALLSGRGDLTLEPRFALSRETMDELSSHGLRVLNGPATNMYFMQLNAQRSPLKSKRLRQSIRDAFLSSLSANASFRSQAEVNPSFIPKGGIGYLPLPVPPKLKPAKSQSAKVEVLFYPLARYPFPRDRRIQESIEDAVIASLQAQGLRPHISRYTDRSEAIRRLRVGDFDVLLRNTGILINDPYADLRMMFLSKLGALIPDPSGSIRGFVEAAEVESDPIKRKLLVEKINTSVFDEAAVITFAHSGLNYIYSRGIELSRLNLFSDPIEFRAVDWKPRG